jgi:hypothetical protein
MTDWLNVATQGQVARQTRTGEGAAYISSSLSSSAPSLLKFCRWRRDVWVGRATEKRGSRILRSSREGIAPLSYKYFLVICLPKMFTYSIFPSDPFSLHFIPR